MKTSQGIPFVGRAGQLLTKMIEAMGFTRDDVYIANVLKCRPPGNRNPEPDEIATCEPFLFRQIASSQPKVIIALGAFAARTLLKTAGSDLAAARPGLRLSRREADSDVPSVVSAAQPRLQARGLGGFEEGVRASSAASPRRRARSRIRVGADAPHPRRRSRSRARRAHVRTSPTSSPIRRSARASSCRWERATLTGWSSVGSVITDLEIRLDGLATRASDDGLRLRRILNPPVADRQSRAATHQGRSSTSSTTRRSCRPTSSR